MIILEILRIPVVMLCCFLLPGYLGQMVFLLRDRRATDIAWWEVGLGAVLASTLWTGVWGMVLLQSGRFSLSALTAGNVAVSLGLVAVIALRRLPWHPHVRRLSTWDGFLVAALVLVAALFLHPHEFLFGGADAGVYVSLGESISQTGDWLVHDETIAALPEDLYPALFREQPPTASTRFLHVPGFYLTDPATGEITPQFYPLHPLWMAIYNAAGGLRFSLYATPVWGFLGVAAVAAVAQALFGGQSGWLSLVLLSSTATQVWFSRYPTAEVLTQYLLFGGIWALILYLRKGTPWHAVLAGAALGQAMLARLDVYFLVAIPAALGLWRLIMGRLSWKDLGFVVPLGLHAGQSLLFAYTRSRPYFMAVYGRYVWLVLGLPPLVIAAAVVLGVIVAALVVHSLNGVGRPAVTQARLNGTWDRSLRILAVVVVVAAVYAYFVRPALADTDASWNYWYGGTEVPVVEPYNMVRLGWYLTPLGLALVVAGTVVVLRHRVTPERALLMSIGLFFSVLFILNSRNNPHHIYVMRRYVPVVIPFFVVMMAFVIDAVWQAKGRIRLAAPVLMVVLTGWLLASAWLEISHVEYDGLLAQVVPWVEDLGEPAIVLFNDDLPVSTGAFLGTPLHYLYGHTVFDLQEEYVDSEALAAQVAVWQGEGRRVVLAEGSHAVPELFSNLERVPLPGFHASYPVLEVSYEHKPQEIWTQTMDVRFYEVLGGQ